MKISPSNFLVGLLIMGFLLYTVFSFIQPLASNGGVEGYNENLRMNFSQKLNPTINSIEGNITGTAQGDPNIFDVIGAFVNSAWISIKSAFITPSVVAGEFMNQSVTEVTNTSSGFTITGVNELRVALLLILTVLVVIGFGAYFLTGRDT